MNKKVLLEILQRIVRRALTENAPAKPQEKPGTKEKPAVAPGKPGEKKEPNRRRIGNPEVKPKPKAMNEEEMLKKIVARFKSKK